MSDNILPAETFLSKRLSPAAPSIWNFTPVFKREEWKSITWKSMKCLFFSNAAEFGKCFLSTFSTSFQIMKCLKQKCWLRRFVQTIFGRLWKNPVKKDVREKMEACGFIYTVCVYIDHRVPPLIWQVTRWCSRKEKRHLNLTAAFVFMLWKMLINLWLNRPLLSYFIYIDYLWFWRNTTTPTSVKNQHICLFPEGDELQRLLSLSCYYITCWDCKFPPCYYISLRPD